MMKNITLLAFALCAFAVMPAQAMDTYKDAIAAKDASRVYALLIAGKPITVNVISNFCDTKAVIDKNLKMAKDSTYSSRDEVIVRTKQSDRLHDIATVFREFIERGNLKKPTSVPRDAWAHFKETVGCLDWSTADNSEGIITAPTYAAFKAEEDKKLSQFISESIAEGRNTKESTPTTQQRMIDELLKDTNEYLKSIEQNKESRASDLDRQLKALPNPMDVLEQLKQDRLKREAQQSNSNNQSKK